MLSYIKWKQLNESFAGTMPLGVSSRGTLGVRGGIDGTRIAFEEAKKRSKKMMNDVEVDAGEPEDGADDGEMVGKGRKERGPSGKDDKGCGFCKKTSKKKSKKYMGADMGEDFGSSSPMMGKKPPFGKGKHPLGKLAMGDDLGDDMPEEDDDMEDKGDEEMGDEHGEHGDEDMDDTGDEEMGDEHGDMDDTGDEEMGDGDMGDEHGDVDPSMGHPKAMGGPLNKHKKPMPHIGMDRDKQGMFMRKQMKKESWWPDEDDWLTSVRSMMAPTNVKNGDGWSEYVEDALLPIPEPENPGPGQVGYAPQGRIGTADGSISGYEEQRKRR